MKMYKDQLNGVTAFENTTKKGETYLTICFLGMKFNCFVPKEKKAQSFFFLNHNQNAINNNPINR